MPFAVVVPTIQSEGSVFGLNALASRFLEAKSRHPCQKLQLVLSAKPASVPQITIFDEADVHPIPKERERERDQTNNNPLTGWCVTHCTATKLLNALRKEYAANAEWANAGDQEKDEGRG